MPNITTFDILDSEIQKVGGKPTVLEVLWDGDTQGWYLLLYIYTLPRHIFNKKETRHFLGEVSISPGMEHFTNGKWTVAELAKEFGTKAKEKYNLTFYFPSQVDADNDCPKWTDRDLAIHCADCNKLIIPTSSPYLPKDICYNCHLKREQNDKIRHATPYKDGVTMYLSKGGEFENIGYCTNFKDFTVAPFIEDKVQKRLTEKPISIVTLDKQDIIELKYTLENILAPKLTNYKKPEIDEQMKRFVTVSKIKYKNGEFELMDKFNNDHYEIRNLIYSIETAEKAINNGYVYKIFFKKGITSRDDTVLRFIHYVCKGVTDRQSIVERYKDILTENEVLTTLQKLEEISCVTLSENNVSITPTGKCVV